MGKTSKQKVPTPAAAPQLAETEVPAAAREKKATARKPRLIRDSFTFPEAEYARIAALKQRAMAAGREVKKSEVLRAGLAALSALSDTALVEVLDGVDKLKPGRPAR